MSESGFKKLEPVVWILYVLLPIFTGWFAYQRLPNEYDEQRHELLRSHSEECGPEGLRSCEVPDEWRDKTTRRIYTASQFTGHRRAEARRIGVTAFAYGLIGCVLFAYGRVVRKRDTFFAGFGKAVVVNLILSLFFYWVT
jgi:hypothetical protein